LSLAQLLGYLVGAGSLLLYTPIILRVARQEGAADGLTLSTWWLKLSAYTATDIYCFSRGFPLSAYVETATITVEVAVLLVLIAGKQGRLLDPWFGAGLGAYAAAAAWASLAAPPEALATGQASSIIFTTLALLPQLRLNAARQDPGGFSPITAALACAGCSIRLFTTRQLAGGDPLLLAGFGLGLVLNGTLLGQILYYGAVVQERPLGALLSSDFRTSLQEEET